MSANQQQIDAAMTKLIELGIAAARAKDTIFTDPIVTQVNDSLVANLPADESVMGQWFDFLKQAFGWELSDGQGNLVVFPQIPG